MHTLILGALCVHTPSIRFTTTESCRSQQKQQYSLRQKLVGAQKKNRSIATSRSTEYRVGANAKPIAFTIGFNFWLRQDSVVANYAVVFVDSDKILSLTPTRFCRSESYSCIEFSQRQNHVGANAKLVRYFLLTAFGTNFICFA